MPERYLHRVWKPLCLGTVLLVLAFFGMACNSPGGDKHNINRPGLLILSHGAPTDQWNEPVNALVGYVRQLNEAKRTFHAVEGAFLEFAQPDAAAGVEKLEAAGCDRIVVVPLFIAPSSHTHFDVPAALGLYSSPAMRRVLKEEGARIAEPKVPVTLTQTLSEGDLLDRFARDELRAFSEEPAKEALVLIAHGCPDHYNLVEEMIRRIAIYCCGQIGVDHADWAFCEVGQSFWNEAATAIAKAAEHKERVLVVGLYVSSSAERIYKTAIKSAQGSMGSEFENLLSDKKVVFSNKGIVDYPATANWVLETATETLE